MFYIKPTLPAYVNVLQFFTIKPINSNRSSHGMRPKMIHTVYHQRRRGVYSWVNDKHTFRFLNLEHKSRTFLVPWVLSNRASDRGSTKRTVAAEWMTMLTFWIMISSSCWLSPKRGSTTSPATGLTLSNCSGCLFLIVSKIYIEKNIIWLHCHS